MRPAAVDLAKLADTVVAELAEQAREQGTILVRTGETGPLVAQADPTQIAVALKALMQNALEAVKSGGSVAVEVAYDPIPELAGQLTPHSALRTPRLSVSDTGPGIPPELRPHIFDPYFCGREAGRGLGLGLSKAWRIAELHGGRIEVESSPGQGAKLSIVLPGNSSAPA
jgi:signal transduction histidine kinase